MLAGKSVFGKSYPQYNQIFFKMFKTLFVNKTSKMSSSFPVLDPLTRVMYITSQILPNIFFLVVDFFYPVQTDPINMFFPISSVLFYKFRYLWNL
jgi:hypothetical protein